MYKRTRSLIYLYYIFIWFTQIFVEIREKYKKSGGRGFFAVWKTMIELARQTFFRLIRFADEMYALKMLSMGWYFSWCHTFFFSLKSFLFMRVLFKMILVEKYRYLFTSYILYKYWRKRNDCVSWCIENEPLTSQMLCTHNLFLSPSLLLSFAFLKKHSDFANEIKTTNTEFDWERKLMCIVHILHTHYTRCSHCSDSIWSFRSLEIHT